VNGIVKQERIALRLTSGAQKAVRILTIYFWLAAAKYFPYSKFEKMKTQKFFNKQVSTSLYRHKEHNCLVGFREYLGFVAVWQPVMKRIWNSTDCE